MTFHGHFPLDLFLSLYACVDALGPNQQFLVILGHFPAFLGWISTKQSIKCLLKDTT